MNDESAARARKWYEEQLEDRLQRIEYDAKWGNQKNKKAAFKDADSYYKMWGQELRDIEQRLSDDKLSPDERKGLEELQIVLRLRLKRVFAVIDPN